MRVTDLLGFAAGVILAASSTVVAQTGPTFPTAPPVTVGGEPSETTAGSGGSTRPSSPVEQGRERLDGADAMQQILPGTEPSAGR